MSILIDKDNPKRHSQAIKSPFEQKNNVIVQIYDALLPISRQLQMHSLTDLIEADRLYLEQFDCNLKWFINNNCDRKRSELLLSKNAESKDGCFLLRSCSKDLNDLSLSVQYNNRQYHYRLMHIEDCYYKIENGEIFFGLDSLIEHLRNKKVLVCRLSVSLNSQYAIPIPIEYRSKGIISILHKACAYGDCGLVKRILLSNDSHIFINARDESGSTPLHIASGCGHEVIVSYLIKSKARTDQHDKYGRLALHRAVEQGSPTTLKVLIDALSNLNATDVNRNSVMHLAARYNSCGCIRLLLEHKVPLLTRNKKLETPEEVARQFKSEEALLILKQAYDSQLKAHYPLNCLHSDITKEEATNLLKLMNNDGAFLIRRDRSQQNYVLSLMAQNQVCNYIIDKSEDGLFHLSNGPMFFSIGQLIEHYSMFLDRLPQKLKHPITTNVEQPSNVETRVDKDLNQLLLPSKSFKSRFSQSFMDRKSPSFDYSNQIYSKRNTSSNDATVSSIYNTSSTTKINPEAKTGKTAKYVQMFNDLFNCTISETTSSPNETNYLSEQNDQNEMPQLIKLNELIFIRAIGEGEFGVVFEGCYKSYSPASTTSIPVAIKQLKIDSLEAINTFKREAQIMTSLKHHCIVRILGIVDENDQLMIIQEFVHKGSLLSFLQDNKQIITMDSIHLWASQIANALQYMESKCVVHRDLSTRNVLVASMNQVKVCDFGLSRNTTNDIYTQQGNGKIPIKWYSLESIEKGIFTSKSDVWSFGVTLWEMCSFGEEPYEDMSSLEVYEHVRKGGKLPKPTQCTKLTFQIICDCTEIDPNKRPTFKKLMFHFKNQLL